MSGWLAASRYFLELTSWSRLLLPLAKLPASSTAVAVESPGGSAMTRVPSRKLKVALTPARPHRWRVVTSTTERAGPMR